MKFTKEEAHKDLVARLTAKGEKLNLSERTINEQLDALMPLIANEETELADFLDKVAPLFKTADANVRNDVSVGIADFKKSYKPEEKKEEVKDDKKDPQADDAYAKLLKRLDDLENEAKANKAKETVNGLKQSFIAKVKEKGVKDDEWLNFYLETAVIDENFDIDAKAEACLKFYNKSKAGIKPDVTPERGGGKSDDKYLNDVIAAASASAKADRGIE
jgi:hypothetical protein